MDNLKQQIINDLYSLYRVREELDRKIEETENALRKALSVSVCDDTPQPAPESKECSPVERRDVQWECSVEKFKVERTPDEPKLLVAQFLLERTEECEIEESASVPFLAIHFRDWLEEKDNHEIFELKEFAEILEASGEQIQEYNGTRRLINRKLKSKR